MDPLTILALIRAGVTTFEQIKAAHQQNALTLTDEQLNQIADELAADDKRRAEKAAKIARGDFSD